MKIELSEPLPTLVERQYKQAKQNNSLIYSETELTTIWTSSGVPVSKYNLVLLRPVFKFTSWTQFQLRFCPALAKKPKKEANPTASEKKPDPFMNPSSDLFVTDIPNTGDAWHFLVLNKFPVIANHFILATKADKPQTNFLEQDDLEATYLCLREWEKHGNGRKLYAFFNSGDHSGASQAHRHLQFLPVESMKRDDEDGEWNVLADTVTAHPGTALPFTCFSKPLSTEPTAQELYDLYTTLLAEAVLAIQMSNKGAFERPTTPEGNTTSEGPPISYNMAMTTTSIAILPRRSEGSAIRNDAGKDVGYVALNGTILAGTLMVKLQEEWDVLRGKTSVLDGLLQSIGVPMHGERQDAGSGKL